MSPHCLNARSSSMMLLQLHLLTLSWPYGKSMSENMSSPVSPDIPCPVRCHCIWHKASLTDCQRLLLDHKYIKEGSKVICLKKNHILFSLASPVLRCLSLAGSTQQTFNMESQVNSFMLAYCIRILAYSIRILCRGKCGMGSPVEGVPLAATNHRKLGLP